MREIDGVDALRALVGQELGTSTWLQIDQSMIDQFAELTGDHTWLHVDKVRADAGPFGTTIAHGFLILAFVPVLAKDVYFVKDVSMIVNRGLNRVRFVSPVRAGARVQCTVRVEEVIEVSDRLGTGVDLIARIDVAVEESATVACVVETVTRYYR